MKPGTFFQATDIWYYKTSKDEIVVLQRNNRHQAQTNDNSPLGISSQGPMVPHADIENMEKLPEPSPSTPELLLRNVDLYLPFNRIEPNKEHYNEGQSCHCPALIPAYHCKAVINLWCERNQKEERTRIRFDVNKVTAKNGLEVKTEFLAPCASHHYEKSDKQRRPVLIVPTPFFLAFRWKHKPFRCAGSTEGPSARLKFFLSRIEVKTEAQILQPYLDTNNGVFEEDNHPTWKEPEEDSELDLWTRNLYGQESLGRVHPTNHPTKIEEIRIYSAMDRKLEVPVIILDPKWPNQLTDYMKEVHRPFYAKGAGEVVCPACILKLDKRTFSIAHFTRSEYIEHYLNYHHSEITAIGIGLPTQLHSRIYQAMTLWMYCEAHMTSEASNLLTKPP